MDKVYLLGVVERQKNEIAELRALLENAVFHHPEQRVKQRKLLELYT